MSLPEFLRTFIRKGFTPRTVESLLKENAVNAETLKPVLNALDILMLGVGAIIGAGVFVLTGEAAKELAGPSIILSYLLSSLAAILLSFSYVEFSVDLPLTGGAFNYIRLVMGEFLAWQVAFSLLLDYTLGSSAISKGFSGYLASLFGLESTTFVFESWIFKIDFLAFGLITGLSLLTYFGTKESASFNTFVTATNVAVILFILLASIGKSNSDHFTPFLAGGIQKTFKAAAVVFFSYLGFDSLCTVAAEIKNPKKNLPVGVVGSIAICTVLYMLMAVALIGLQYYKDIDTSAPFSEAFVSVNMRWAAHIVSLGALTGIVTSLLVSILGMSRILVILGREKLVPAWMATIDEKRNTPRNALLVQWLLSGILALLFDIDVLSKIVSMGSLFVLAMVSIAALQRMYTPQINVLSVSKPFLFRMGLIIVASIVEGAAFSMNAHPAIYGIALSVALMTALTMYWIPVEYVPASFVTPLKPLTPCAAVVAAIHFMFQLGREAHLLFFSWTLFGICVYAFYGIQHTKDPIETTEEIQMREQDGIPASRLLQGISERSDVARL